MHFYEEKKLAYLVVKMHTFEKKWHIWSQNCVIWNSSPRFDWQLCIHWRLGCANLSSFLVVTYRLTFQILEFLRSLCVLWRRVYRKYAYFLKPKSSDVFNGSSDAVCLVIMRWLAFGCFFCVVNMRWKLRGDPFSLLIMRWLAFGVWEYVVIMRCRLSSDV